MLTLAIDCALPPATVALAVDGVIIATWCQKPDDRNSDAMVTGLRDLALGQGVSLNNLDRIVVTNGPGSFTGLRVGLALAQGLQLASGAHAFQLGTLHAIALKAITEKHDDLVTFGLPLRVLSDARRGHVFMQEFTAEGASLSDCRVLDVPDAVAMALGSENPITGPGVARLADWLDVRFPVAPEADYAFGRLSRRYLGEFASTADVLVSAPERLNLAPVEKIRPLYLKKPDATPSKPEFTRG